MNYIFNTISYGGQVSVVYREIRQVIDTVDNSTCVLIN
jgi:hypothetical protein